MKRLETIAVIPARGGSKSIPKKNLADLGGIPLIAHIINSALSTSYQMDVIVSTEDSKIAETAKYYGAEVPFARPQELAEDHVHSLPVIQHAIWEVEKYKQKRYELIALLQPTAPLCIPQDIDACIEKLINKNAETVLALTEVGVHPLRMKRLIDEDRVINYIDQGYEDMRPRQVLPKVYKRAGSVYVSRRHVVMEKNTLVGEPCLGVIVPPERAIDIDSPLDLELARFVYSRLKSELS